MKRESVTFSPAWVGGIVRFSAYQLLSLVSFPSKPPMDIPKTKIINGVQSCPYLHDDGTKTCNTCHERKPIDQFGKDKDCAHGYLNRCKRCTAIRQRNSKTYKASWKKWYEKRMADPVWRERENQRTKERRLQAPDKHKARRICQKAVEKGVILKRPCEVCGSEKSQAHHPNYSRPLAVIWLCQDHHGVEHRIHK